MNSKELSYQGRLVSVVEVKGGWTTILDGMKQIKVRNSELSAPVSGKAAAKPKADPKKKAERQQIARDKKAARDLGDDHRLVRPDLVRYTTHAEVKTASGRKAIDIADTVASQLRGVDLTDAYREAAKATGQTQKALRERYEHLNPGMQRMNLGNLIRGAASAAAREAAKAKKAAK